MLIISILFDKFDVYHNEKIMKVVYFGNNLFSSCLKYLMDEDHQILRVYKNSSLHDSSIIDRLCENNNTPIYEHKPNLSELNDLISLGAEMFIVAEYSYLVPDTKVKYAFNIHPTLLPNGRGPTPLPYLIRTPEFSGVTIHKICNNFDSGDIILQARLPLSIEESLTSLMIKVHLESVKLLKVLFEDIEHYYQSAHPQTEHSHWPKIKAAERILDWHLPINKIKIQMKSFGHIGLLIKLNNELWKTSHVELIEYVHVFQPGNVIFEDASLLAVASVDGIATIHKNSISLVSMDASV